MGVQKTSRKKRSRNKRDKEFVKCMKKISMVAEKTSQVLNNLREIHKLRSPSTNKFPNGGFVIGASKDDRCESSVVIEPTCVDDLLIGDITKRASGKTVNIDVSPLVTEDISEKINECVRKAFSD